MSRHVSAENLALYREEVLSARKMARIRSHLSGCETCAATSSELAAVPLLLARSSAPPMPDRLAERIQLALASEATARADVSANAEAVGGERGAGAHHTTEDAAPVVVPGRPDLPERARPRSRRFRLPDLTSPLVLRVVAATGAVAVIAAVGFVLANNTQSPTEGGGTSASSPTRSVAARPVHRPAGGTPGLAVHYRLNGRSETASVLTSNVNYTRQSIGEQARKQVAKSPNMATAAPQATSNSSAAGVNVGTLGTCLTVVAAGRRVLVVDVAQYIGKPAVIIIMRPLRAIKFLDVAVVGLACSASDTHAITSLQVPAS